MGMKGNRRTAKELLEELMERYPELEVCRDAILTAFEQLLLCCKRGGKLLCAGNGGSAADCDHIVGELVKSFQYKRPIPLKLKDDLKHMFGNDGVALANMLEGGLSAIALPSMSAINTAYANDVDAAAAFAQMTHAIGKAGDVFWGITTSGNSENILMALMAAKACGLITICLTGRTGGKCKRFSDVCICVPEDETYKIQELHLPIYHALCGMLEAEFFQNY